MDRTIYQELKFTQLKIQTYDWRYFYECKKIELCLQVHPVNLYLSFSNLFLFCLNHQINFR